MIKAQMGSDPMSVMLGLSSLNLETLLAHSPIMFDGSEIGLSAGPFFISSSVENKSQIDSTYPNATHLALSPTDIEVLQKGELLEFSLSDIGADDGLAYVLSGATEESMLEAFREAGLLEGTSLLEPSFQIRDLNSGVATKSIGPVKQHHIFDLWTALISIGVSVVFVVLFSIFSSLSGGIFIAVILVLVSLYDKTYERVGLLTFGEKGFRVHLDGVETALLWKDILVLNLTKNEQGDIVRLQADAVGVSVLLSDSFSNWPGVLSEFEARGFAIKETK